MTTIIPRCLPMGDKVHVTVNHGHGNTTEALIVISQVTFFIVLFVMIKSYLLDNFGIMNSADGLKKNALQIAAIYFAIIVLIGMLMIPLYHYEYALLVIIGVICGVSFAIYKDVFNTLNGKTKEDETSQLPKMKQSKDLFRKNDTKVDTTLSLEF